MSQSEHVAKLMAATYEYVTERSLATWNGKRPGLRWCRQGGWRSYSCGAFRSWRIHLIDGRVGFSADGFRVRENRKYGGGIYVLTGNAEWVIPPDNSRSHHSLALGATEGGKVVCVTGESGPWDAVIGPLTEMIHQALENMRESIRVYDEREAQILAANRAAELAAAQSAATT